VTHDSAVTVTVAGPSYGHRHGDGLSLRLGASESHGRVWPTARRRALEVGRHTGITHRDVYRHGHGDRDVLSPRPAHGASEPQHAHGGSGT
jgi:hypothetical protein